MIYQVFGIIVARQTTSLINSIIFDTDDLQEFVFFHSTHTKKCLQESWFNIYPLG